MEQFRGLLPNVQPTCEMTSYRNRRGVIQRTRAWRFISIYLSGDLKGCTRNHPCDAGRAPATRRHHRR
eukprot:scaffold120714_cov69-Phaeocystis_antarctica.AAC.5